MYTSFQSIYSSIHTLFSDSSPVHPDQGSSHLMFFSIEDVKRQKSIYLATAIS
jgi:hypothetical protein